MTYTEHYWIVDDAHTVTPADHAAWASWFAEADRTVAWSELHQPFAVPVRVETTAMGFDALWQDGDAQPPRIFETVIVRNGADDETWRWPSWEAAMIGHQVVVARLSSGELPRH